MGCFLQLRNDGLARQVGTTSIQGDRLSSQYCNPFMMRQYARGCARLWEQARLLSNVRVLSDEEVKALHKGKKEGKKSR